MITTNGRLRALTNRAARRLLLAALSASSIVLATALGHAEPGLVLEKTALAAADRQGLEKAIAAERVAHPEAFRAVEAVHVPPRGEEGEREQSKAERHAVADSGGPLLTRASTLNPVQPGTRNFPGGSPHRPAIPRVSTPPIG